MKEIEIFFIEYEVQIRLGFFFGVFLLMALWEMIAPRRKLLVSKLMRWSNNITLVFLNTLILRVLFPAAAVGMAVFSREHGWGIFNYYEFSPLVSVVSSIIILDAMIYLQHVVVHAVPVLWRIHRVHHADPDFDVTTGARFHPLEIILSMLIKFAVIVLIGPPVVAVIVFEILLNVSAMFNHSNIKLNTSVDKLLRCVIVTPDMHRVHHSIDADETNSNFGFNLPWWDHIFGTYKAQPRAGHENMIIGIDGYNQMKQVTWLSGMLTLPFTGKPGRYPINARMFRDNESS